MIDEAERGADAAANVRFGAAQILGGATEIRAYGTAVVVE